MFRPMKRYQILTDVGVASFFLLISLYFSLAFGWPGLDSYEVQYLPLKVVPVVIVFCIALALRRWSPGLSPRRIR